MPMYGKVFPEIFESTLMAEGGRDAVYVFMCMIALKDKYGIVPTDKRILARKIDMDLEDLERAIAILTAPDETSNLPDYDGRRLIPLSELDEHEGNRGWWIVNHYHYRNKASKDDRKEQNRVNQQNQRDKKKQTSASVSNSQQASAAVSSRTQTSAPSAYTDTDTDTDTDKDKEKTKTRRFTPPTLGQISQYCLERKNGLNPQAILDHYETSHWIRGKTPIKDWKACVRTWENKNPIVNDRTAGAI